MKKTFRTVKTGFIFGILLLSLFAIFIPTSSAGPLKAPPLIIVTYPPQDENVIPNSGVLDIVLETTLDLTGPWRSFVEESPLLSGSPIQIRLKVESSPPWCDASIANPTVSIPLDEIEPRESRLTLTVTEQAPAFQQGTVIVSATSVALPGLLFTITEERYDYDISFEIGYWPVITFEHQKGTLMEIGPLDTADFPIEIENLGNGLTYVMIEPIDIPGGDWSINIASSVMLASSVGGEAGATKTVHLTIKPPYGFGFHKDIETFKVKFTPYAIGTDLVGTPEIITFNVQSVGMSPGVGFEIPLIVSVFVIIGVVIYLFRRRKQ